MVGISCHVMWLGLFVEWLKRVLTLFVSTAGCRALRVNCAWYSQGVTVLWVIINYYCDGVTLYYRIHIELIVVLCHINVICPHGTLLSSLFSSWFRLALPFLIAIWDAISFPIPATVDRPGGKVKAAASGSFHPGQQIAPWEKERLEIVF